jgi:hypothetical protein
MPQHTHTRTLPGRRDAPASGERQPLHCKGLHRLQIDAKHSEVVRADVNTRPVEVEGAPRAAAGLAGGLRVPRPVVAVLHDDLAPGRVQEVGPQLDVLLAAARVCGGARVDGRGGSWAWGECG